MGEYENLTNLRPIYIGDVNNPNIEKLTISPCPSITVNVQGLTTITISPSNPTVSVGHTQQFTVICQDQDDNITTCPTITWDTTDPILGTITPTGLFTAVASSGTVTVTATGDSIVGSATVTLSTAPVQHILANPYLMAIGLIGLGIIIFEKKK